MGCDIHLYTEVRKNGKWVSADKWTKCKYDKRRLTVENHAYEGRSYYLFSILANVRNGHGFAGVKTGVGFVPIATPKGLPSDCSKEVSRESDGWDGDGHSHSYFTVAELMAYDWTQASRLEGWIDAVEYERWNRWDRQHGEGPESYSGSVFGGNIRHVSEAEMKAAVESAQAQIKDLPWDQQKAKFAALTAHLYTHVKWTLQYFKCARSFLSDTLPILWRLGKPEDVRIVFWFDN